jgi:hypothetical protein
LFSAKGALRYLLRE